MKVSIVPLLRKAFAKRFQIPTSDCSLQTVIFQLFFVNSCKINDKNRHNRKQKKKSNALRKPGAILYTAKMPHKQSKQPRNTPLSIFFGFSFAVFSIYQTFIFRSPRFHYFFSQKLISRGFLQLFHYQEVPPFSRFFDWKPAAQ